MFDSSRQYTQNELSPEVFNAGSGAGGNIVNYNGRAVKVGNNGNGTRSLSDLGDWGAYNTNQQNTQNATNATNTMNDKFTQDKNDITDFLGRYAAGTQNAIDKSNADFHVNDLLNDPAIGVNALNTRIQDLKNNFSNTGAGGYANSGQVDAALNSRILPQYATQMSNYLNANTAAQSERDALTQPYKTEGQLLQDRLAREYTGFSEEQQRELEGYIAKLQSGTQLSVADIQAANALAVAQKQYQATVDSQKLQNQFQTVPAGSTLSNTFTNQIINPGILAASGAYKG